MRPNPFLCLALLGTLVTGCTEPVEYADWIIDVPEGTRVIEYPGVGPEDRDPDAIRLVEDLVIGANPEEPSAGVFNPGFVVATADGTIFVADHAAHQVQMYDADGVHLRTLGREGQGPGEFQTFNGMTIAGDELVISDAGNIRLSVWSLAGDHLEDHHAGTRANARRRAQGLEDGSLIARSSEWTRDVAEPFETGFVLRYTSDGEELARFGEFLEAPPIVPTPDMTSTDIAHALFELIASPLRSVTVGAGRFVYVSPVHEYQISRFTPAGDPVWAIRVAWPRPGYSERVRYQVVYQASRGMPSPVRAEDLDWPPKYRAVGELLTDAAGRLHVLLNIESDDPPPDRIPTDVYSPEGDRLAAGYLPVQWYEEPLSAFRPPWSYAAGDHVYGIRADANGEMVAFRGRLTIADR